jgi:hypothetical protein
MTNDLAVAEGLEPSMTGLTVRRFTNLATPQCCTLCFVLCALYFVLWSVTEPGAERLLPVIGIVAVASLLVL